MNAPFANRLEHINFGKVKGMGTRKGNVKFLEQIIDIAKESMLAQMQTNAEKFNNVEDPDATSDQIGMTCVKVCALSKLLTRFSIIIILICIQIQDMQAKR
jgi:arginyl-tRNA synthetase